MTTVFRREPCRCPKDFNGNLSVDKKMASLGPKQLLMRGTVLRRGCPGVNGRFHWQNIAIFFEARPDASPIHHDILGELLPIPEIRVCQRCAQVITSAGTRIDACASWLNRKTLSLLRGGVPGGPIDDPSETDCGASLRCDSLHRQWHQELRKSSHLCFQGDLFADPPASFREDGEEFKACTHEAVEFGSYNQQGYVDSSVPGLSYGLSSPLSSPQVCISFVVHL